MISIYDGTHPALSGWNIVRDTGTCLAAGGRRTQFHAFRQTARCVLAYVVPGNVVKAQIGCRECKAVRGDVALARTAIRLSLFEYGFTPY